MGVFVSLIAVLALIAIAIVGAGAAKLQYLFGVILPYTAMAIFIAGIIYRVLRWAQSAVPFRIPTTCGQQKSLPWVKANNLETPHNIWGVLGRMALEVLLFRSLFRNTRAELRDGPRLAYAPTKWLWAAGLAFHWSFLIIFLRHFKYFVEPVPAWVSGMQSLDGFFQIGLPIILLTDIVIVVAVSFLFVRRLWDRKLRYLSLPSDYFPLLLILGIALSGIYMRYFVKTDIIAVKELGTGLLSLHPILPHGIATEFFVHLFLVSTLAAYFPFSKLLHAPGVFFSPTRNLVSNNRRKRHINPWDYPVKVHTYEEYEDEFRDVMKAAGLPVEKE
jgi:nitrate reductase gamma subunit